MLLEAPADLDFRPTQVSVCRPMVRWRRRRRSPIFELWNVAQRPTSGTTSDRCRRSCFVGCCRRV